MPGHVSKLIITCNYHLCLDVTNQSQRNEPTSSAIIVIAMAESAALVCVDDYEKRARSLLDRNASGYYTSGANDEQTLGDNVNDFKRYALSLQSVPTATLLLNK